MVKGCRMTPLCVLVFTVHINSSVNITGGLLTISSEEIFCYFLELHKYAGVFRICQWLSVSKNFQTSKQTHTHTLRHSIFLPGNSAGNKLNLLNPKHTTFCQEQDLKSPERRQHMVTVSLLHYCFVKLLCVEKSHLHVRWCLIFPTLFCLFGDLYNKWIIKTPHQLFTV